MALAAPPPVEEQVAKAIAAAADPPPAAEAAAGLGKQPVKPAPPPAPEAVEHEESDTDPAPPPEGDEPGEPAAIAEHVKLARAGDLEAALKAAFGEDTKHFKELSKGFAASRHTKHKLQEREGKLAAREQELGAYEQRLIRWARAEVAYHDGDVLGALKNAFGDEHNDVIRKAVAQAKGQDPRLTKVERQLEEERQLRLQREREAAEARAKSEQEQRRSAYVENLSTELRSSTDAKVAKAAQSDKFVARVFDVLREHYDRDTDETIPTAQAARIALDRIKQEISPFADLLGTESDNSSPGQTGKPGGTGKAERPSVDQPTPSAAQSPKGKSLKRNAAAESSARPPVKGENPQEQLERLLQKYTPMMAGDLG